jgi:hypothetical protein
MIRKLALIGVAGALTLGLAGCDDGESGPSSALTGTAAVGAPIVGAAVTLKCTGASADIVTDLTDANGVFSVSKADMEAVNAAPPCALQITSGGITLFSIAESTGRANISPLTNLVVARAIVASGAAANAAAWFSSGASFTTVTPAQIDSAIAAVETALQTATGEADVPFDIFTTKFKADAKSTYDVWLESLKTQLTTGGANYTTAYNALVTSYAGGGALPVFTITLPSTGGGGGGGGVGNLVISVKNLAVNQELARINNSPIPANKAEFCADEDFKDFTDDFVALGGTSTCSFSGTTGKYTIKVASTTTVVTFAWTRVAAI